MVEDQEDEEEVEDLVMIVVKCPKEIASCKMMLKMKTKVNSQVEVVEEEGEEATIQGLISPMFNITTVTDMTIMRGNVVTLQKKKRESQSW